MGNELLNTLRQLEEELHRTEVRRNAARLDELLHAEFEEIGRSGRHYDKAEILEEFSEEGELPAIKAENYSLALLAEEVALLTYTSMHVDNLGLPHRHTLRSSLWVRSESGWQLRFHQGTPASA